jgi:hypothetical protein
VVCRRPGPRTRSSPSTARRTASRAPSSRSTTKAFLERSFDDAEGNLYEGAFGSDLLSDVVPSFDQDNGDDIDFMDLRALVDALDALDDPEQFLADASAVIDLDLFLVPDHGRHRDLPRPRGRLRL